MKRRLSTTIALVGCALVCLAFAANLTGKWSGNLKTPDGNDITLTYNFKADSGKITGTAESPQGTVDITDGKYKGDNLSFNLSVNGTEAKHTGKYYAAGDSIGLDIDFNDRKFHTTLKRDAGK